MDQYLTSLIIEEYLEADVLGSHYDEGRITRETDADPIWATLAQRSIANYRNLETKTGISFYSEVGCLTIGPKGSAYTESVERNSQKQNIPIQRCIKQDLQTLFPYLRRDHTKTYLFTKSRSGHISPRRLVMAQKTAAHLRGCEIINDTAISIQKALEGDQGEVVIGTRKNGDIYARRVLLCPGAFINYHRLLPEGCEVEVKVDTELAVRAEVSGKELARLKEMPVMIMFTGKMPDVDDFYLLPPIQYPNGKHYMKIGHHKSFKKELKNLEEVKQWFAKSGDKDIGEFLLQLLHHYIDFEETSVEIDGAVTAGTPTKYPFCGMVSPSIGILTGGNGYGAKSSDEIGRMGAKLIAKGEWDHDLPEELFRPQFKSQKSNKSKL
ncbi:hypothetical protein BSL78_25544 [Apostichopus japonicus]|uniref:FAD dependent oxidoreductase domain-containing protein n=1 Tax=Stichopus japonicus TaxID=307972 RepID=A0A2G8JPH1_STIJA|nr:hypothetical protein BSL78_25544 [Apostichopus japonicus]